MAIPAAVAGSLAGGSEWLHRDTFPPGPQLALVLSQSAESIPADAELMVAARAARRQMAWAAARQLALLAALSERRHAQTADAPVGSPRVLEATESLIEEIAVGLGVTSRAATTLLTMADRLAHDLPAMRALLETGQISVDHVRILCEALVGLPVPLIPLLDAAVAPDAPDLTTGQFRNRVKAALRALDPDRFDERVKATAKRHRRLEKWDNPTGTTDLALCDLPPEQAHAIYNKITAVAQAMRTDGDTRTLDQLRADLATALLHGTTLPTAAQTLHTPTPPTPDAATRTPSHTTLTASGQTTEPHNAVHENGIPRETEHNGPADVPTEAAGASPNSPDNAPSRTGRPGQNGPPDVPSRSSGTRQNDPDHVTSETVEAGQKGPDDVPSETGKAGHNDPDDTPSRTNGAGQNDPDHMASETVGTGQNGHDDAPNGTRRTGQNGPDDGPSEAVETGHNDPDDVPTEAGGASQNGPDDTPSSTGRAGQNSPPDVPSRTSGARQNDPDHVASETVGTGQNGPDDVIGEAGGGNGAAMVALDPRPGGRSAEVGAQLPQLLAQVVDQELVAIAVQARADGRLDQLAALTTRAMRRIELGLSALRDDHCRTTGIDPRQHGHNGYKPTVGIQRLIETRHPRCVFPSCNQPASRCDLDHTRPYDKGGTTCPCNLAPLCRRHHRTKQTPGWHLFQIWPGLLIWITPNGTWRITTPHPRH